jgi:hypothetical protein
VIRHGGHISSTPGRTTSFLVADSMGSSKTFQAKGNHIPVVTEEWVQQSIKAGKLSTDKSQILSGEVSGGGASNGAASKGPAKKSKAKAAASEEFGVAVSICLMLVSTVGSGASSSEADRRNHICRSRDRHRVRCTGSWFCHLVAWCS